MFRNRQLYVVSSSRVEHGLDPKKLGNFFGASSGCYPQLGYLDVT